MKTKKLSAFCRRQLGAASLLMPVFLFSCATEQKPALPLEQPVDLNKTIGNLADLYQFNAIEVRGFGIAAGLNGTGSSECPPALRAELEKYIRQQLPKTGGLSPRQFIDSPNTAVVEINGTIPRLAEKKETFDLLVFPIDRTTASLDGGYVYTAPLKERSTFVRYDQYAKTFASAHGQLFRNKLDQENASNWYLLGGGTVENEAALSLVLREPSFQAVNVIRNRLNERFGPDTATAVSSSEISLKIPPRYREQKERFLSMVHKFYLMNEEAAVKRHIEGLLEKLKKETDKTDAEIGLEAVGKRVLNRLAPLLGSADDKIRFHAARCMLNLGDEEALSVMEAFSKDTNNPYCLAALETIGLTVRPRKSEPILLRAASSDLPDVRLTAYRQLERIQSSSISRNLIADSFVVDRVFCSGRPLIYVFRSEAPKIVLFGSPIHCKPDVFLQSENTGILLNAKPEDKMIAVSRRHPNRPRLIGPIYSNRELSALIRTLGESADPSDNPKKQPGLAVPYQDIILLLKQLAENKMVDAEFLAGPMTQAGSFLQKTAQNDR
ncbi:MAG TPA: flagellar basal body P-ring protein FlgI [Anaerohalosphaeraceae bacterium]|nr:flagellar basal body P-ring protein FlgI [Anaerohalosphaeraceae bacterium]